MSGPSPKSLFFLLTTLAWRLWGICALNWGNAVLYAKGPKRYQREAIYLTLYVSLVIWHQLIGLPPFPLASPPPT